MNLWKQTHDNIIFMQDKVKPYISHTMSASLLPLHNSRFIWARNGISINYIQSYCMYLTLPVKVIIFHNRNLNPGLVR